MQTTVEQYSANHQERTERKEIDMDRKNKQTLEQIVIKERNVSIVSFYEMVIFFGEASSDLAMQTSSTPFSNLALMFDLSTFSGRGIVRENEPYRRS